MAGRLSLYFEFYGEVEDGHSNMTQHEGDHSDAQHVIALEEAESEAQPSEYALDWINDGTVQLHEAPSEGVERPRSLPQDRQTAAVILTEDLDFFTALLNESEPPLPTTRVHEFDSEEHRAQGESHEAELRGAELRRTEELMGMQADMDFYLMLMQQG